MEILPKRQTVPVSKIFMIYLRHLGRYPWLFFGSVAGVVVAQLADVGAPLYVRDFFNGLAMGVSSESVHLLLSALILVSLLWLINWAAWRVFSFSVDALEAHVMSDLTLTAFRYLVGHSHHFFTSNFAGSLTHKVNKFARAFESLFDSIVSAFLQIFLFVSGAAIVLFIRSFWLGLLFVIGSVLYVWLQLTLARRNQPLRETRAEADTRLTGTLADTISNHSTAALFANERHEITLLNHMLDVWSTAAWRNWGAETWDWTYLHLLAVAINVSLLFASIVLWKQGNMTVGDFALVQFYVIGAFARLGSMHSNLRRYFGALADASEMVAILDTPYDIKDAPNATALTVSEGQIVFAKVNFYFHETRNVLEHFDLTIKGGERVALVGSSGAGKSTITKLLLRLYDVSGGAIEIDGQNIARVTQESLRTAISFVPQEPVLFHRTLMDNIRYGRLGASDKEVIEAAKQAHCHEFISQLPERYQTYVGERGIKLSGGERQRVAIARAILKNAPILVLDEATSSLDSESESLIQDALETLMRGKTVIVIAHRLSTIMKMDRIIVVEQGAIAAQGTHEELLTQGGLYQKLWSIQAGGFLQDGEGAEGEE